MPRRRLMVLPAACALGVLVASAPNAGAATTSPAGSTDSAHCAVDLDRAEEGEAGAVRCFDTFAESIEHATGGLVQLPVDATSVSDRILEKTGAVATEETARQYAASQRSTLVGVEYQSSGYGGESLALAASSNCFQGDHWNFPDLGKYGWDNKPSSAKVYSGCSATHYQHPSQRGGSKACYETCSSLGSMDNRTSSIRFW